MSATLFTHSGGCRCGAVRFEANAEPFYTSYCHCSDCRHASGAPVAAFVGFYTKEVTIQGDAASYGIDPVSRGFCAKCGAPLWYTDARITDQIFFILGAMDNPQEFAPRLHWYVSEELPFLRMDDGLPRHQTHTALRPDDEL